MEVANKLGIKINIGYNKDTCSPEGKYIKFIEAAKSKIADISNVQIGLVSVGSSDFIWSEVKKVAAICEKHNLELCAVPAYYLGKLNKPITSEVFLETIEYYSEHCNLITVYPTVNRELGQPITSRGGICTWDLMAKNNIENPYLEYLREMVEICTKNNCMISIGNAYRLPAVTATEKQVETFFKEHELQKKIYWSIPTRSKIIETGGHMSKKTFECWLQTLKQSDPNIKFGIFGPELNDACKGRDDTVAVIGSFLTLEALKDKIGTLVCITKDEHIKIPSALSLVNALQEFVVIQQMHKNIQSEMEDDTKKCNTAASIFNVKSGECNICGDLCPFKYNSEDFNKSKTRN